MGVEDELLKERTDNMAAENHLMMDKVMILNLRYVNALADIVNLQRLLLNIASKTR